MLRQNSVCLGVFLISTILIVVMKIFNIILIGLITVIAIVGYKTPYSQCNTPLTYKIGTIDSKFNFKNDEALTDLEKGSQILSKVYGKRLFEYASGSGELTINFVYDERTALKSDINNLEGKINQKDNSLQQQVGKYQADVKALQKKVNDLNTLIQKYNNSGGVTPDVYNNIVSQQNELKSEGNALNDRAKQLNLASSDFNSQVKTLNQNVNQFNQTLEQKPEEGQYSEADKTITVYFIEDRSELVHLLAHEFGHALGMDHVNNNLAIMYPYTTNSLEVQAEDKQQLETVCQEMPLLKHWIKIMADNVNRISIK